MRISITRKSIPGILLPIVIVLLSACAVTPDHPDSCDFTDRGVIYFGLSRNNGTNVSDQEWKNFVQQSISRTFPLGFTLVDAEGGWRMGSRLEFEPSRMLIVLSKESDLEQKLIAVADDFRVRFAQQAVIVETTRTCARLVESS